MSDLLAIHATMFRFQRRAWWQLSSLVEQEKHQEEIPKIKVVYSVNVIDPYLAAFKEACYSALSDSSLKNKIEVSFIDWDNELFGERGKVRTKILQTESYEFLLLADADIVFHPTYFSRLASYLKVLRGDHRMMSVPRYSMSVEDGYKLADQVQFDKFISNAWEKASAVPSKHWSFHGRISGAGYFQLLHLPTIREFLLKTTGKIEYVPYHRKCDTNILTDPVNKTYSDIKFRKRIGGVIPLTDMGDVIHINHWRHHDPQWSTVLQN